MKKKLTISTLLTTLLIVGCGGSGEEGEKRDNSLDTTVSGTIYEDVNSNGKKDNEETGSDNIKVTITDAKGEDHIIMTDLTGKYRLPRVADGLIYIDIDTNTLPKDATLKDNNHSYNVKTDVSNEVEPIAYTLPPLETASKTGEVHGRVFLDFDESYDYSNGEIGIYGVSIKIIDFNGTIYPLKTDKDGLYSVTNIPVGKATIQVKDDDSAIRAVATPREGIDRSTQNFIKDANVTINIIEGKKNKVNDIGYFAKSSTLGLVSGTIFFDTNNNGLYDDDDERLVGIDVNIKDSEGVTHTIESRDATGHPAYKGTYLLSVTPGEVEIIVNVNDPDLYPYKKTIGYEVDNEVVEAGLKTHAGGFGFTNKQ